MIHPAARQRVQIAERIRGPYTFAALLRAFASKPQITLYRVTTQIPPPGTLAVASTTDCEA